MVPAPPSLYQFRARNLHGSCIESHRKSSPLGRGCDLVSAMNSLRLTNHGPVPLKPIIHSMLGRKEGRKRGRKEGRKKGRQGRQSNIPTLSVWCSTLLKLLGGPGQGQITEKCTEATRAESHQLTGSGIRDPVWKTTVSEPFGKLTLEWVSTYSALLIDSNTEGYCSPLRFQQILLYWARH